ncbi:DUF6518 family protein [Actinoplanes sp. KI2]|uniref:DUF6518 family protein n=1 Tax=Actinoplanes sp. KI2 TaxID=2983315 RepID=UPI0021D59F64|nr:DUF6518 family protein [Actinoplanes sp. KI2]MCU7728356.1 DUF6518 family protein [Actinoplanes sp. KI2]
MKVNNSVALIAPGAGIVLGVLDFVWIAYVPSPFGGLGNSIAVWAVAAFLLTLSSRWDLPRAAVAAAVFLVVAVPSYYVAAALIQHDDWSIIYSGPALLWMGFGVLAGVVFGAGGVLARTPTRWQAPAFALPAAVLAAEAVLQLSRPGKSTASLGYAAVLLILAVAVTLVVAPSWRTRGLALAYALPLTAVGYLMLLAGGFR